MTDVCVTGLGAVTPLGNAPQTIFDRLLRGQTGIALKTFPQIGDVLLACADFDAHAKFSKSALIGADRVAEMALLASDSALSDAQIVSFESPLRVGIFCGCALGGIHAYQRAFDHHAKAKRPPPSTIPAVMPNGAAAMIAIARQVRGPVITYSVACASSTVAIIEAKRAIQRGEIDIALAGGADAQLIEPVIASWQSLQTLANVGGHTADAGCKPFDACRSGFVLGEGSAFLVLESKESTEKRGGQIYAYVRGVGISCDGVHLTKPSVDGQVHAMRLALAEAGLSPASVGYCNAHATGTIAGDPVECEAMRRVWGASIKQTAVSATKSAHGHLIAATGAMEAMISVMALVRGAIPPTTSTSKISADCEGLCHILRFGIDAPDLNAVISNSFAFGGTNASIVFSKH